VRATVLIDHVTLARSTNGLGGGGSRDPAVPGLGDPPEPMPAGSGTGDAGMGFDTGASRIADTRRPV
jgi:hypothetical protein